jgi:hypothetical protein
MLEIKVIGNAQDGSTYEGGHPWMLTDSSTRSVYHFQAYRAHVPDMKKRSDDLHFCKGFDEKKPCKIITTKKGGELLVNCSEEEDQKVTLLTIYGKFRGAIMGLFRYEGDGKLLHSGTISTKNCSPQQNIIIVGDYKLIVVLSGRSGDNERYFLDQDGNELTHDYILDQIGLDKEVTNMEKEINKWYVDEAKTKLSETFWAKYLKHSPDGLDLLKEKFNNR